MVLAALTGVLMEPGMIRQQLGGVGRSGLTTGNDLVQALAINHVTAVAQDYVPEGALEACDTAWEHGYPVIALGHWMSPDYLHWMLLDNKVAQWLVFIDPWTGKEKQIDRLIMTGLPVPLVYAKIVDAMGKDLPHDGIATGELVLKAGAKGDQHIVDIKPNGSGSIIDLVHVDVRGFGE